MSDDTTTSRPDTRLVWDLPLRVTHWALALAVAGCFATHYAGIEWFAWHRRCGYAVLVLTVFRVLWGIVGTRHARFANFVRGPGAVLQYLRGKAAWPVGHNPLGALSVLALLSLLLLQAGTGLFANDEIMSTGPFYGWIVPELSNRITTLHRNSSEVLLVLVALHVAAIAWYVRVRREPLVVPMLTGQKPAADVPAGEAIDRSRTALAVAIVVVLATALALAVRAAPESTIALY
jgi:cytochrome b